MDKTYRTKTLKKIRLGIIGTSDIALRRFVPALKRCNKIEYVGVASRTKCAAEAFVKVAGGRPYVGYDEMLNDEMIDAVYIPLPPSLHFQWAQNALMIGKHVLLEKPLTPRLDDTERLISLAKDNGLALFENYTFMHHNQIDKIRDLLNGNAIGLIRLIKASFEFPKRAENDFRYSYSLGGGALLDCGGYTVKLASSLLGESTYVADAFLVSEEREVDLFGNVVLRNASGLTAQLSFGMDNDYRCDLEICGSEGTIEASRIFTAPDAFEACVSVFSNGKTIKEYLMADDQFLRSIEKFCDCVKSKKAREDELSDIIFQSHLVNEVKGFNIKSRKG